MRMCVCAEEREKPGVWPSVRPKKEKGPPGVLYLLKVQRDKEVRVLYIYIYIRGSLTSLGKISRFYKFTIYTEFCIYRFHAGERFLLWRFFFYIYTR